MVEREMGQPLVLQGKWAHLANRLGCRVVERPLWTQLPNVVRESGSCK